MIVLTAPLTEVIDHAGYFIQMALASLPIWMEVMKAWIGDRKEPPTFEPPGNIVFVSVDNSGASTDAAAPGAISEAFIAGTQPGGLR